MSPLPRSLRRLLTVPELPDREDERVASTLHVVVLACLLVALVWAPLSLLLFPGEWLRSSVVLAVAGVAVWARHLTAQGRLRAASWALVAMFWGVFSYAVAVAGGIGAPARSGYLVLVVVSGLLLGARSALVASALCVATLGGFAALDARGALPQPPFAYGALHVWWIESVYFLVTGVLVALAATRIREALASARRSERQLDASRRRYQSIAENALDPILEMAPSGRILYASPNVSSILGYPPEELVGRDALQFVHPAEQADVAAALAELRDAGELRPEPQRVRGRDGRFAWVESTARSYVDEQGERRVVVILRDVGGRMEALEAQRASDERFRRLSEHSRELVAEMDGAGIIRYASPNHLEVLGYAGDEFEGLHVRDAMALMEAVSAGGIGDHRLVQVRHRDGSQRWLEVAGSSYRDSQGEPRGLSVTRDVTERLRIEEGLRQTQRLESLGVLAGGIAHDFNNLLTAMLGNASVALQELPESSPARAYLKDVEVSATRAAELTGQMLAYAGKARRIPQRIDLPGLVKSVARLVEPSIHPEIHLEYDLPASLPPVEADPAQAQQVVMNLLTNASEAIGERAGHIRIALGAVDAGRELLDDTLLGRELPEGRYVWLSVSDTGCGMDDTTLSHAFDPFFTTKFTGRGLGLAALLGIARTHSATLRVQSELGRGTRFEVLFPAASSEVTTEVQVSSRRHAWREGDGILVVDDDPLVRAVARRVLAASGIDVVQAAGGEEALRQLADRGEQIAAVVLDLTMPGLDGMATLEALRRLRPELAVVLSSGYGSDVLSERIAGSSRIDILPKPYRAEDLVASLERVLGGEATSA